MFLRELGAPQDTGILLVLQTKTPKPETGESFYLRVYGKLNHNIRCTLRGYRNLMGDFTGNTIYTGFKKIYTGKSQLHTQHIPRGIVGEFDIMTCRDLGNGEVQYFRIRYD